MIVTTDEDKTTKGHQTSSTKITSKQIMKSEEEDHEDVYYRSPDQMIQYEEDKNDASPALIMAK